MTSVIGSERSMLSNQRSPVNRRFVGFREWISDEIFLFLLFLMFSPSVMSNSLQSHRLQHPRLPCPSPFPGAFSDSCPLSWWCHPTISSSVFPFSYCLQSFLVSGSFLMSQLFSSGGQSIGASASVLPMNIQDWFPLGFNGFRRKTWPRAWRRSLVLKAKVWCFEGWS